MASLDNYSDSVGKRVQILETLCTQLKTNMDLLNPAETVKFQATTVQMLKDIGNRLVVIDKKFDSQRSEMDTQVDKKIAAIDEKFTENIDEHRKAANRRTNLVLTIIGLVVAVSHILAVYYK